MVKATGAQIQTTVNGLTPDVMGTCGEFEEVQVGAERFNIFKDCPEVIDFFLNSKINFFSIEQDRYSRYQRWC